MYEFIKIYILSTILAIITTFALAFYHKPEIKSASVSSMLDTINDYRRERNQSHFETDEYLCELANKRAIEIVSDWSHDGFYDLDYPYVYEAYGENLARYFHDDQKLFEAWLASDTHRAIIQGDYNVACIGRVYVGNDEYVVLETAKKE